MLWLLLRAVMLLLLLVGALGWVTRGLRAARRAQRQVREAQRSFVRQPNELNGQIAEASQAGKGQLVPGDSLLAQDRATGKLYALACVSFSTPDPGPSTSAIFVWSGRAWHLEQLLEATPQEALHQHRKTLVSLGSMERAS